MSRNALPRIAFVSHSPWVAGAERVLINLLEHLPKQKIQPIVLFPNTKGPVKEIVKDKLKLPVFDLSYGFCLPKTSQCGCSVQKKEVVAFANLYRELEVDAVVVNTTVLFPAAAATVCAGIPLMVHSHGAISPRLFPGLDLPAWIKLKSLQLNIADKVLVPSAWVSTQCIRSCHLPKADITILPNGTNLPELDADAGAVNQARVPEFVMLCTLEPNKGVLTFLEAAAIIIAKRPTSATFTIYGDGAQEYRELLLSFINKHNLESSCFLHCKQENVDSVYRSCYATVVASEIESFSLVAIEAMSYAKPVIATRSGGPEDIVQDGKTGYLISVGDSESLAERMIQLMDDPSLVRQMGLAGRERIKSHYDINDIASKYLDHILSLLVKPRNAEMLKRKALFMDLAKPEVQDDFTHTDPNFQVIHPKSRRNFFSETAGQDILLNTLLKIKQSFKETF